MLDIMSKKYTFIMWDFVIIIAAKGFSDGSEIKNPPAMQEMQVRSLGQEDLLEE